MTSAMRRKLAAGRAELAEGGPGADRGWRMALARAARDHLKLTLEVQALTLGRVSLAEVLEAPEERSLIAVLEGPAGGLGMLALSPEVTQSMIEGLTLGRVQAGPVSPRRPTRTDAAMIAPMIEAALADLQEGLADEADFTWAGSWRYASFLDDIRPLGLMLEEEAYRLMRAEVSLGGRAGRVHLALPAEGRAELPVAARGPAREEGLTAHAFAAALAEQVEAAPSTLNAVLSRLALPLSAVMAFQVDEVLALPAAQIDRVSFEGMDGRPLGEGKLGQNRGMRAIRLTASSPATGRAAPHTRSAVLSDGGATPAEALRQSA